LQTTVWKIWHKLATNHQNYHKNDLKANVLNSYTDTVRLMNLSTGLRNLRRSDPNPVSVLDFLDSKQSIIGLANPDTHKKHIDAGVENILSVTKGKQTLFDTHPIKSLSRYHNAAYAAIVSTNGDPQNYISSPDQSIVFVPPEMPHCSPENKSSNPNARAVWVIKYKSETTDWSDEGEWQNPNIHKPSQENLDSSST
jgi:hypothetical protein